MTDEERTNSIDRPVSHGPLWFASKRRGQAKHYKSWQDYLADRREGDESKSIYNVAKKATTRSGTEKLESGSWHRLSIEIPWMTFVLGSGCLMTPDSTPEGSAREGLRTRLERDLSQLARAHSDLALVELAATFVESLARDRVGIRDGGGPDEAGLTAQQVNTRAGIKPVEYPSLVAAAAALATRLYAGALASDVHVVGPANRERVTLNLDSWWGATTKEELLEPLRDLLGRLGKVDANSAQSQAALAALANRMLQGLRTTSEEGDRPGVLRTHIELLTAFAWYFLTEGTTVYPGWSDLLLFQSLEDKEWFEHEADDPNPRPRLQDVVSQDGWVYDRIVQVTNTSWTQRSTSTEPTSMANFYNLIASFLAQQAEAISARRMPDGWAAPPPPVCFVSSFDLELEMSLWLRGKPFIVVMPVFASEDSRPSAASPHWVWAKLDPTSEQPPAGGTVTADQNVQKSRWQGAVHPELILPRGLVHPARWVKLGDKLPAPWEGLPVVVRLTGSPLMDPPEVRGTFRLTKESSKVHHALLLDEYTAIQQAALDFSRQPNSGLPSWITFTSGTSAPRFWMLMGTQVADTGIRLRLMAQLMAAQLPASGEREPDATAGSRLAVQSSASGERKPAATSDSRLPVQSSGEPAPPEPPEVETQQRLGLLLNEKSGTNDRELFLWNDLDVVDGTHLTCVKELEELLQQLHTDFQAIAEAKDHSATTQPTRA